MNNNKLPPIREMFDSISSRYDLLNRLLSLGCDIYWRKKMVSKVKLFQCIDILDVACGTGDIIIEIVRQMKGLSNIVGLDFSEKMLAEANKKIVVEKNDNNVNFIVGDAVFPPFSEKSFDAITIAFGIRNVHDRFGALKNFYSLLRDEGMIFILELSVPKATGFISKSFMFYFEKILPVIGRILSKNSFAYNYLFTSVLGFPSSKKFALMMTESGFSKVVCQRLTGGIANLFIGYKQ